MEIPYPLVKCPQCGRNRFRYATNQGDDLSIIHIYEYHECGTEVFSREKTGEATFFKLHWYRREGDVFIQIDPLSRFK
jgi:hypothetical protein